MGITLVLKLVSGDLNQGFTVLLQVKKDPEGLCLLERVGHLPADHQLEDLYQHWQTSFRHLIHQGRNGSAIDWGIIDGPTNICRDSDFEACKNYIWRLEDNMERWLCSSPDTGWQQVKEEIRFQLGKHSSEVRLVIQSDAQLWKLPWLAWKLLQLDSSPGKEEIGIGFSPLEYQKLEAITRGERQGNSVRILAVFGSGKNLDLEPDRRAINQLPNAEVETLNEPSGTELIKKLREQQGWDIFCFSGHSQTKGRDGIIYINETENLELRQFQEALKTAIRQGLKLAIFNSCDGLGLAEKLAGLQLPVAIVMKEPVPDPVAQCFLKVFLSEYAAGAPLYTAVRRSQTQLKEEFLRFPGCNSLPIICQNPAEVPPTWAELSENRLFDAVPTPVQHTSNSSVGFENVPRKTSRMFPKKRSFRTAMIASLGVTLLLSAIRTLGWLQMWELPAFDYLLRKQPVADYAPHLIVVLATEKDFQKLQEKGQLSDRTLARLIERIQGYNPAGIGFAIYRDAPIGGGREELVYQMNQANPPVAICQTYIYGEPLREGHFPPQDFSKVQLSFNDVPRDVDGIIRRHLLKIDPHPASPCAAKEAFSFKLALTYLDKLGIPTEFSPRDQVWQLGKARFNPLTKLYAGGYQNLDPKQDLGGYQVLLNYRPYRQPSDIAQTVTITDILDDRANLSYLSNRVVLIGYEQNDSVKTPFTAGHLPPQELPGVFLHAQMVSQIIDAALGNRPLLRWLPRWGDVLWIWGWSLVGALLSWQMRSPLKLGVFAGISLALLCQFCFGFLKQGIWMPLVPSALALVLTIFATLWLYHHTRPTEKYIKSLELINHEID